jgi:CRP-like cAMP-binding protein
MPPRQFDGHHLDDLVVLLGNVRIFRPLSLSDVKEVAESLRREHFGEGDVLVREGERGKSLFILIEGLLDVFVEQEGRPRRVGRIHPGECFGEMSLLTGQRRSATVRATCESIVYEVGRKSIRHVMERRPALAETLSQLLAEHELGRELALESDAEEAPVDELESFAHQIMTRMRDFLDLHRGSQKED